MSQGELDLEPDTEPAYEEITQHERLYALADAVRGSFTCNEQQRVPRLPVEERHGGDWESCWKCMAEWALGDDSAERRAR